VIQLFGFQSQASAQIAQRFADYWHDPPWRGTRNNPRKVPFYQAVEAITGAGKTAILADAVERMRTILPIEPFVMWLSKGRVVVAQTYANLQDGGKYHHLIDSFTVHLLSEYRPEYAADIKSAHLFFATVGTFNQKDKERGDRLIFKSEIDTADLSIWAGIKKREDIEGRRRPLIIVYDEAQNLSDQQTELLLELDPDAFLVASATMRIPVALAKVISDLKDSDWTDETIVTTIPADDVAVSGLIKEELSIGGYQTPMERAINDLLADLSQADQACAAERVAFRPKAIYVAKTNIVAGNSFQRDDPKKPFDKRQAPPIVIWRYLVQQGIPAESIAVYCTLDFDKNFPHPKEFVLFRGGDADYEEFSTGDYRHIIFNLSLQEGWDDPACYFAYVDKSMGSAVQVEQLVGRVLRQPGATHYEREILNTAHFYVRVDAKNVFAEVVQAVRGRIQRDAPAMRITAYGAGSGSRPQVLPVKQHRAIAKVYANSEDVLPRVNALIDDLTDYRGASPSNVRGEGARAVILQRVGDKSESELKWTPIDHSNPVTARWVFQRAVQRLYPKALDLARSDDPKFDAMVEVGSKAYRALERLAEDVVEAYFRDVRLAQRPHNPYVVAEIKADENKIVPFRHALHKGYAGLNPLELQFAEELDNTKLAWCRNPSRIGFGIPLLSVGRTSEFYPDFLVWKDDDVYALDTTGEQLLMEKTWRKLLAIDPSKDVVGKLFVRLISEGKWNDQVEKTAKDGYTIWRLREDRKIGMEYVSDVRDAVHASLSLKSTAKVYARR